LTRDSQTPNFSIFKDFATVVAIAYRTNSTFGSIDKISAHNSPPDRTGGEIRKQKTNLNKKSVILAAERSKEPPSQFLASFMETLLYEIEKISKLKVPRPSHVQQKEGAVETFKKTLHKSFVKY
jgi:hypothetical protein